MKHFIATIVLTFLYTQTLFALDGTWVCADSNAEGVSFRIDLEHMVMCNGPGYPFVEEPCVDLETNAITEVADSYDWGGPYKEIVALTDEGNLIQSVRIWENGGRIYPQWAQEFRHAYAVGQLKNSRGVPFFIDNQQTFPDDPNEIKLSHCTRLVDFVR